MKTIESQKKESKNFSKELTWEQLRNSLEEDKHLTEEELEEKYGGLNLAWD